MRRFFEASLVLTISVVVTVAIMVVIFPTHARGGEAGLEVPTIAPAVLIYGSHDRPNNGGAVLAPSLSDRSEMAACPYLAARAAATKCPAAPRRNVESMCPYLSRQHQSPDQATTQREKPRGQHT